MGGKGNQESFSKWNDIVPYIEEFSPIQQLDILYQRAHVGSYAFQDGGNASLTKRLQLYNDYFKKAEKYFRETGTKHKDHGAAMKSRIFLENMLIKVEEGEKEERAHHRSRSNKKESHSDRRRDDRSSSDRRDYKKKDPDRRGDDDRSRSRSKDRKSHRR